jgi:hypothetical protein
MMEFKPMELVFEFTNGLAVRLHLRVNTVLLLHDLVYDEL